MRAILVPLIALIVIRCVDDSDHVHPPPPTVWGSPIRALETAYRTMDSGLLQSFLAHDPHRNAEFRFLLSAPDEDGEIRWGYAAEFSVHRRMFDPGRTLSTARPVSTELWPRSISINLSQQSEWIEEMDLYSNDHGADGRLDPAQWRAWSAVYSTDLFVDTRGRLDYRVAGFARFVMIEDLLTSDGGPGRLLLLVWEDLGSSEPGTSATSDVSWSQLKALYK